VLVVDNRPVGSAAPAALREAFGAESKVRYVAERRRGSSEARNCGLREARGEIIAFADDDVIIDRRWVGAMTAAFAADPELACVTGLILPSELETEAQVLIEEYGGYSKGFTPRLFDLHEHKLDTPLYPYAAGAFGSGASIAFRREVLAAIGGYDPALGAGVPTRGGEDLDVQLRTVLSGHRLRYEPAAIVWHAHHRSDRALRTQIHGYGVGLTAMLLKQMVTSRRARTDILKRIPAGLRFQFRSDSTKNANKQDGYPPALMALELAGQARGPLAYAQARFTQRRVLRRHEARSS
jgi:GT2 family glycosyltransferase